MEYFQKCRSRFGMVHFHAQRGVAAIGSMAEPQQRRNAFLPFSEKGHGISETHG
jgi:hypothetical protein